MLGWWILPDRTNFETLTSGELDAHLKRMNFYQKPEHFKRMLEEEFLVVAREAIEGGVLGSWDREDRRSLPTADRVAGGGDHSAAVRTAASGDHSVGGIGGLSGDGVSAGGGGGATKVASTSSTSTSTIAQQEESKKRGRKARPSSSKKNRRAKKNPKEEL